MRALLAVFLALVCCKSAPPEAVAPRAFTLVYEGNLDGEIEPCG